VEKQWPTSGYSLKKQGRVFEKGAGQGFFEEGAEVLGERFVSVNPATGETLAVYHSQGATESLAILARVDAAFSLWRETPFAERARLLRSLGAVLRAKAPVMAIQASREMGKLACEAEAGIRKSAGLCDYYADNARSMLADEAVPIGDGRAFVAYEPLGVILAVMPWNFPFWQPLRFAVPALAAGNCALLKPALNVPGCSLALEEAFRDAGFPEDVFRVVFTPDDEVESLIADKRVRGVALTGSVAAGRAVAGAAGRHLKKTVLELGGSDPLVVLEDADLKECLDTAVMSRMRVCGQTCIAAKRFIVVEARLEAFLEGYLARLGSYIPGDPLDPAARFGPMAREDLLETLHAQVTRSVDMGARLLAGGKRIDRPGFFYEPTLLGGVKKGMPAWDEELFGPVGAVAAARDEESALALANDTDYGLGASIWTRDRERGERLARRMESGAVAVNALTRSDPRLPFGGVKNSGWGRELSRFGLLEFVNIKTVRVF
jgi:succinate-semialdehyde dehydrogenase / glutarate-semialdehyde dehydrogenase